MRRAAYAVPILLLSTGMFTLRGLSQAKPSGGFDRMKELTGTWDGINSEKEALTSRIRLVSNGTALEEIFQSGSDSQMVTLYSRDGNRLAMIHICSLGNQPRMETPMGASDANAFDFQFTGATNLSSPEDPHMHRMQLQVIDNDHFTETWTLQAHGAQQTDVFHFTREKS